MALKTSPGEVFVAVTASDSTNLPSGSCRGIYVGVAGDVALYGADDAVGTSVVFKNLVAGVVHPLAARRVLSTGTTATDIVAVY